MRSDASVREHRSHNHPSLAIASRAHVLAQNATVDCTLLFSSINHATVPRARSLCTRKPENSKQSETQHLDLRARGILTSPMAPSLQQKLFVEFVGTALLCFTVSCLPKVAEDMVGITVGGVLR